MLNDNEEVLKVRSNFFSEDNFKYISTNKFIKRRLSFFIWIYKRNIQKIENEKINVLLEYMISLVLHKFIIASNEFKNFTKAQYIKIIYTNNNLIKEFIDIACLFHNRLDSNQLCLIQNFKIKNPFKICIIQNYILFLLMELFF